MSEHAAPGFIGERAAAGAKPPGFIEDVWLSAILLAAFLAMTATSLDYPPIARAVPMLVGCLGAGLSATQLVRTMRTRRPAAGPTSPVSWRHVAMFVWLVAAAAIVSVFGILAGGTFFVAAFLRGRLHESWPSAIQAGLLLSAVLHLTLERGLGVYLFEGLIWR